MPARMNKGCVMNGCFIAEYSSRVQRYYVNSTQVTILLASATLPFTSSSWHILWHALGWLVKTTLVTHASIAAGMDRAFSRVCLSVCLSVCILTGKRLELSTPNLVHIYFIAVAQHALIQRSKGQRSRSHSYENRHGRMVASDHGSYFVTQYAAVLAAAVAGVGLHVDTAAYVF